MQKDSDRENCSRRQLRSGHRAGQKTRIRSCEVACSINGENLLVNQIKFANWLRMGPCAVGVGWARLVFGAQEQVTVTDDASVR